MYLKIRTNVHINKYHNAKYCKIMLNINNGIQHSVHQH